MVRRMFGSGSERFWPRPLDPAGRRKLLEYRSGLIAEMEALDARQHEIAGRLAEINRELADLRDVLWPRHTFRNGNRPDVGGPPPRSEPPAGATAVRGAALRKVVRRIVDRADRPLTLREVHRLLHAGGHVVGSRGPAVKALADALGHEVDARRVRRVSRGVYASARASMNAS